MSITVKIDLEKLRRHFLRQRLIAGFSPITAERVRHELDDLAIHLNSRGGCPLDAQVNLQLLSELRQSYSVFLAADYPTKASQEQVVTLELTLLKKLVSGSPMVILKSILVRLEDLYTSGAADGFTDGSGRLNERLEATGGIVKRRGIQVDWSCFPIMETFVAARELEDRLMRQDALAAAQKYHSFLKSIGEDKNVGS